MSAASQIYTLNPFLQAFFAEGQLSFCQSRVAQYQFIGTLPLPLHGNCIYAAVQQLLYILVSKAYTAECSNKIHAGGFAADLDTVSKKLTQAFDKAMD